MFLQTRYQLCMGVQRPSAALVVATLLLSFSLRLAVPSAVDSLLRGGCVRLVAAGGRTGRCAIQAEANAQAEHCILSSPVKLSPACGQFRRVNGLRLLDACSRVLNFVPPELPPTWHFIFHDALHPRPPNRV